MKLKEEVTTDGGKQDDFFGATKPLVSKQIEEWIDMGVMRRVHKKPDYIIPLILIPNRGKPGFRICHDLRMLNAITVKDWGPAMDQTARLQGIPRGEFFSVLDFTKVFMQIPI